MRVRYCPFIKSIGVSLVYGAELWMSWQVLPEDEGRQSQPSKWRRGRPGGGGDGEDRGKLPQRHLSTAIV